MKSADLMRAFRPSGLRRSATAVLALGFVCGLMPPVHAAPKKKNAPAPATTQPVEAPAPPKKKRTLFGKDSIFKGLNKKEDPADPGVPATEKTKEAPAKALPPPPAPASAAPKKPASTGPAVKYPSAEFLAIINGTGPLFRSDLQQLAIQANPDFWRFRSEAAMAAAAEEAAWDWPDPELRLGFTKEFETDLRRPYTESRSITEYESGDYFNSSQENYYRSFTDENGFPAGTPGTQTQTQRVTENRAIRREEVVRVKPGKYQDIIETKIYETEVRKEKNKESQKNREGIITETQDGTTNDTSKRRLVGTRREVRNHVNDAYPDEQYEVTLRFNVPNPWEMKAKAARARAERDLSEDRMRLEMRDVIFDVGRRYDELQFQHAWHRQNERLVDLQLASLVETERLHEKSKTVPPKDPLATPPAADPLTGPSSDLLTPPDLADLALASASNNLFDFNALPRARLEVIKAREEVFDSRKRVLEATEQLCLLSGVNDPSRIVFTNILRIRELDPAKLDYDTLVEIARSNRADLKEMDSRANLARARSQEVKSSRVPWLNDVRFGWARTHSDGYRDQDELSVLVTMSLPFFSWFYNKEHKQWDEGVVRFQEARDFLARSVDGQVAFALNSLRESARELDRRSVFEKESLEALAKNEAEADSFGDNAERIRLDARELRIKLDRSRLQTIYLYNQAVTRLELALGMTLEELFDVRK